ncbi:MAG: 2'-5' RNA ligase family protein [Anaerolineales bacterium]
MATPSITYEAALVLLVPEAEPLVGPLRAKYDPVLPMGVPAHITINYPFLPGVEPSQQRLAELARLVGGSDPFPFNLTRLARFPDVVYLEPEPAEPFVALIERVADRFPDSPPFGGEFKTIVPHLTVAQSDDLEELLEVERKLREISRGVLPISAIAKSVWLMDDRNGRWERRREFPLGGI